MNNLYSLMINYIIQIMNVKMCNYTNERNMFKLVKYIGFFFIIQHQNEQFSTSVGTLV